MAIEHQTEFQQHPVVPVEKIDFYSVPRESRPFITATSSSVAFASGGALIGTTIAGPIGGVVGACAGIIAGVVMYGIRGSTSSSS